MTIFLYVHKHNTCNVSINIHCYSSYVIRCLALSLGNIDRIVKYASQNDSRLLRWLFPKEKKHRNKNISFAALLTFFSISTLYIIMAVQQSQYNDVYYICVKGFYKRLIRSLSVGKILRGVVYFVNNLTWV